MSSDIEFLLADEPNMVVLIGAGVSMMGPSNLPSGFQLLDSSLRKFVVDSRLQDYLETALDEMKDKVVPETIFQRVKDILGYVPMGVYEYFSTAEPNRIHRMLVEAALKYGTRLFTTNFDLLIERCFPNDSCESEVGLELLPRGSAHNERRHPTSIDVVHLHGDIGHPESMFNTIRRVGKGLEPSLEGAFADALDHCDMLLCLGYSGLDDDVMRVIADHNPPCIKWAVKCLPDPAQKNCARARLNNLDYVECNLKIIAGLPSRFCEPPKDNQRTSSSESISVSFGDQAEIVAGCFQQIDLYEESLDVVDSALECPNLSKERRFSLSVIAAHAQNRLGNQEEAMRYLAPFANDTSLSKESMYRFHTERGLALCDSKPPRVEEARWHLNEALSFAKTISRTSDHGDDDRYLGNAYHNLGYLESCAAMNGDVSSGKAAIAHYKKALSYKRKCGDIPYLITTLRNMAAHIVVDCGCSAEGEGSPDEYLEFERYCATYNNDWDYAYYWAMLADLHKSAKNIEEAKSCARRGLELYGKLKGEDEMIKYLNKLLEGLG